MSKFRFENSWKIDWVGNVSRDDGKQPGGAQDYVIDNLKPGEYPIHSYTQKFGKLWGALKFDDINRLLKSNHGLYEILQPFLKRKVYFDIDKTTRTLQEVKDIILKQFPNARLQISGREGSWHIILSNYYADNLEKMDNVKRFTMMHVDDGFDKAVYTKNRNMKCINQKKLDKKVNNVIIKQPLQLYVEGSKTLSKHLILHDFDEDAINVDTVEFDFPDEGDDKVITKHKAVPLDILSIPQQDLPLPQEFDWLTATPLDKLAILPCPPRDTPGAHDHQVCWQVMLWCKSVGIQYDQFWQWCRRKDPSVARYKKYLDAWKGNYMVSPKLVDVMLQRYFPSIRESPSTMKFRKQFDLTGRVLVDGIDGKYLDQSHIKPPVRRGTTRAKSALDKFIVPTEPLQKGVEHSLLDGPMGINKTGAAIDYLLRHMKPGDRALWLTPRITLANNTLYRLADAKINVVNYKDLTTAEKIAKEGPMENADFVICSIQSLHYLTKRFDYIIIDECETVFYTFADNAVTHKKNLIRNWQFLLWFVSSAKKVIYMDAFMTNLTLNFVKGMIRLSDTHLNNHYEVVKTKAEATPRVFVEMATFDNWMTYILDHLANGKKLYIFTPFKGGKQGVEWITDRITKFFGWKENENVMSYYAEKEEEKKKLSDVEKLWGNEKVRCVVTNSTISVGVNFNEKDVFDNVFAHYSPMIPVRDFLQSIYRVRHPKSNTMMLLRSKYHGFGHDKLHISNHPDCDIYRQLRTDIDIEQLAYKNVNKWQTFHMMCEYANITIYPMNIDVAVTENKVYLDHLAEEVDLLFNYKRIKDITNHQEFEDKLFKSYSNTATLDDRLEIQKYMFRRMFPDNADEEEMITVWNKKKDFVDSIHKLLWNEEHIINRLLEENNLKLSSTLPNGMHTKIPVSEILEHLHFDKSIKNYKSGLVSQMLNAYFQMKVYGIKKRKREDGSDEEELERKRVKGQSKFEYVYEESKDYRELMDICLPYCQEVVETRKTQQENL